MRRNDLKRILNLKRKFIIGPIPEVFLIGRFKWDIYSRQIIKKFEYFKNKT